MRLSSRAIVSMTLTAALSAAVAYADSPAPRPSSSASAPTTSAPVTSAPQAGGTTSPKSAVAPSSGGSVSTGASDSASASSTSVSPAVSTSTAMPTGNVTSNGRTWVPVVSQDFTANAAIGSFAKVYGSSWNGYSGYSDTSGKGLYAPDKVLSVSGGLLDWYLRSVNGQPLVAAPTPTGWTGQTYGRYAVRYRGDAVPGYKIAFLLWPVNDNWNEGEIDSQDGNLGLKLYPASAIKGTLKNGSPSFDKPPQANAITMGTGWHTAVTEWSAGKVRWYEDGKLVGETTIPSGVPTTNMRWTLQVETNNEGKPVPTTAAGHVQVDWVVQYK